MWTNLFRKKDKVMVAKATIGPPFILEPMESRSVVVNYYCYEREDGKRFFTVEDHGRGLIHSTGLLYKKLKRWVKKGQLAIADIPSYNDIKSGERSPIILSKRMR